MSHTPFCESGFSRETELIGYRERHKTRSITEIGSCGYGGEQSHSLQSVSWRMGNVGGVIQSESEGLRTGRQMVWVPVWFPKLKNHVRWCLRTGEDGRHSSGKMQMHRSFTFVFHLSPQQTGDAYLCWWGPTCFTHWFTYLSHLEIPRNNVLSALWASLSQVTLKQKISQGMPQVASKSPEARGEVWRRIFPPPLRRNQPCRYPDLRLAASRIIRQSPSLWCFETTALANEDVEKTKPLHFSTWTSNWPKCAMTKASRESPTALRRLRNEAPRVSA